VARGPGRGTARKVQDVARQAVPNHTDWGRLSSLSLTLFGPAT
jgi:hypothetical protein